MTRHFFVYPSADPRFGLRCAAKWLERGYEVLMGVDAYETCMERPDGRPMIWQLPKPWTGYYGPNGINPLITEAFKRGAELVTSGGDDQLPPTQGAAEHADLYAKRFPDGYGVMQCTGDRQGEVINGKYNAERICGSPTFGRAWHERAFGGRGGLPVGFSSYFADELLKEVAERLGLLYQEPTLVIDHAHHAFGRAQRRTWHERAQLNWTADYLTYERVRADGFKHYLEMFK